MGGTGEGLHAEGGAGVRGAASAGPRVEAPVGVGGGGGAEPPNCHGTNLKCSINKFCHEMRHDLWR